MASTPPEKSASAKTNDEINITGGWGGQVTEPLKTSKIAESLVAKKGRIILRGVVQGGARGIRLQVYDNELIKQVEVQSGFWAKGIRDGDIIMVMGYWKDKSYVKAYRIHNETTGVDFKPSPTLGYIFLMILCFIGIGLIIKLGSSRSGGGMFTTISVVLLIAIIILVGKRINKK